MRPELRYPALAVAAASASARLRRWVGFFTRREALPLLLLLAALSTVFLFANDRGLFYRPGHHDWNSAFYLSIASNLSLEHNLRLFPGFVLTEDETLVPTMYSRFPVGGYLLMKLAIAPFGDDFSAQIYSARILFLSFFAGSALLAYLSLCRLLADRWIALSATLLAFASYYLLYYNDMLATENGLSLFGVMLTFHGMVRFEQEGRFRQLLVRACAALLLGWQVYALLLPYIVFGLGRDLWQTRSGIAGRRPIWRTIIGRYASALPASRYLRLGIVALLFGIGTLSFNLGNEYFAYDGKVPLPELPTVRSAIYRLGTVTEFKTNFSEALQWGSFLQSQLHNIGQMMLPFLMIPVASDTGNAIFNEVGRQEFIPGFTGVFIGAAALAICGIGLIFARHKMLLATLMLTGICWAALLRVNVAVHEFDAVFYIGIPLTAFALTLLYIRKQAGRPFIAAFAAIALTLFALSSAEMAAVGQTAKTDEYEKAVMADFAAIREITPGKVVYVDGNHRDPKFGGAPTASSYFLTNSVLAFESTPWDYQWHAKPETVRTRLSDYIITLTREEGSGLVTPNNKHVFLYDRAIYDGSYDETHLGSPLIISDWNVYVLYNNIIYVNSECSGLDNVFHLHIFPLDANDLDDASKTIGFNNRDFSFTAFAVRQGPRCVAVRPLPDYAVSLIRTGQYNAAGRVWSGEFAPPE